jgi:hypothetical protein
MRVRLVWADRDSRGSELSKREAILYGESVKTPTRKQVARLIARHYPELRYAQPGHALWTHRGRLQVVCQSQQNGFQLLEIRVCGTA